MDRFHPGVYIEEIPSGVQPIEGVSTSNTAFIGKAEKGTLAAANLVTSLSDFQKEYGTYLSDSYLAYAVYQFFNNGGKHAYIVRVAGPGATAASITIKDRKGAQTMVVEAIDEGAWGNSLSLVITDSAANPNNAFTLQVLQDRSTNNPPLPALLLETMDGLVMDPTSPNFVETVATAKSLYIRVQADAANRTTATSGTSRSANLHVGDGSAALKLGVANGGTETVGTAATKGTSVSGAGPATNPAADQRAFSIDLNGDGAQEVVIGPVPATGADIATAIQAAVRALSPIDPANQAAYTGFTCAFGAVYTLTSGTAGVSSAVVVTASATKAVSLATALGFMITINGDGPHLVNIAATSGGGAIAAAIQTAVRAISPNRSANRTAFTAFTAAYDDTSNAANSPALVLTSGAPATSSSIVVTNSPALNAAGILGLGLSNGGIEITGAAVLRPQDSAQPNTEYHLGVATVAGNVVSVAPGADGTLPGDGEHIGGLSALDIIHDVNIVCIPGISSANVVSSGTNYCAQRADCFFIGDPHPTDETVADAQTFVNSLTVKNSYGAVYYPWLQIADPTGVSTSPTLAPPSGFVAGLYAQTDAKRGVWKAPAGTQANLAGAVGLVADTTDAQQDFLNPIGVNVIRSFPSSGIVVWGARTLATLSDPEYRYIPVRRTAIFLEQSLYNGIQYAVFEPNDSGLWSSLRLNVGAFMMQQFRAGAFQGSTPNDAFFVKADETTTTQQDIDSGTVNILVGFAPLKPAEFVVLQLTQKVGQSAV